MMGIPGLLCVAAGACAVAGREQGCFGVAQYGVQRPGIADIDAALKRIGHVVVVVPDRLLTGRKQLQWRHGNVCGLEVSDIERIVVVVLRSADTDALVEGAERSGLVRCSPARGPFPLLSDDRNDAADGVRAVKAALRAAQYFDLGRVADEEMRKVDRAVWRGGIADVEAVDQDLGVVGMGAAQEDGGRAVYGIPGSRCPAR